MTKVHIEFGTRLTGLPRETVGMVDRVTTPHRVLFINQTHSKTVVTLDTLEDHIYDADAVVTRLKYLGLAIKTADCAPVLLFDEQAGVIAAVHSGWQGTLQNIIAPTIEAMQQQGAQPSAIQVAIGPCLQRDNFEMGPDVYAKFRDEQAAYAEHFQAMPDGDKYLFDNVGLIVWQLKQCGVTHVAVDTTCTVAQSDDYFSYRTRHKDVLHDTMRNVSVIWMEAN